MPGPVQRPEPVIKLPPEAKKVFSGAIFEVYQWQQELFDGSTTTFEVLKRPDTVEVIPVTRDKKIILLEQQQPGDKVRLGFPGGRMEPGEDPVTAGLREMKEESGYTADSLELLQASQILDKMDWVVYIFSAKNAVPAGVPNPDAGEKISVKLVDFDEFIDIVLTPGFRDPEIIRMILEAKLDPLRMAEFKAKLYD